MMRIVVVVIILALGVVARAAITPLPTGNSGIAARFPGDANIASDPAVIFADDFESYASSSGLTSRWSSLFQSANTRIATEAGNYFAGSKALEFRIPQMNGEVSNSIIKTLSPERDTVFLRWYSKYDPAFNVLGSSHNGGVIWAHYCCPGVKADGFNKFLVSFEASRFSSSTPNPGELNAYVYHPDQRDGFGDHFFPNGTITPFASVPPFTFGPDFVPRAQVRPVLGQWYSYELMVKANTPGQRDGRIGMWLDGALIADFPNLRFRETTNLKVDRITLDFHINANNPAAVRKWYDNVVVATSYIGPVSTGTSQLPAAPTNLRIVSEG